MSNITGGGIWPAANWDLFPETRIGGLVIVSLFIIAVAVICAIPASRNVCCRLHRRPVWLLVLQAVGVGFLIALSAHFVPCVWWTCDWGPSDGQGVRGAIWFGGWGLLSLGICCYAFCATPGDRGELVSTSKPAILAGAAC